MMKLLGKFGLNNLKALSILVLSMLSILIPGQAFASGGENVALKFSASDQIYLYISLVMGAVAIIYAMVLSKKVNSMSPGDEKMQEVGKAIYDGAMAYLKQQVSMMLYFVVALAVGLFFLYQSKFGSMLGVAIAISFILGVAASYIAGYAGMKMAVKGNMRTAAAALTSYKKTLEVAFQSGAVAGMVTVGMGLIGATLIFLLAKEEAMKLLVGFGFGGSLAALFMRVGGGIFTKAADVGADLVGKVEAGIPEDDPRNPATIADNVGDNVGDCAGMAADVFESYEVTLVAAIVLGAATASIFDQQTWMKLILFALMARGVGIIASIIGIASVKGSDNLDADPLLAIRKGFWLSAGVAAAGTLGLAFFMMKDIKTSQVENLDSIRMQERAAVLDVRNSLALAEKKQNWEITADQVAKKIEDTADLKAKFDFQPNSAQPTITSYLNSESQPVTEPKELTGYTKVNLDDASNPLSKYSAMSFNSTTNKQEYVALDAFLKDEKNLQQVIEVSVQRKEQKGPDGQVQPGDKEPSTAWIVANPKQLDDQIKQAEQFATISKGKSFPVEYFVNAGGDIVLGFSGEVKNPHRVVGASATSYYMMSAADMTSRAASADATKPMPPMKQMQLAVVNQKSVPWYLFALAIIIGIAMAFAFEYMTDYYVSTHKKPVQEVAGVATAGPAPMIIQGFALACESSVFSVLAIVISLMLPLFLFPAADYGSLILSFYGIALVGLGLLTTTGFILAMDTFGPISDNAQGVFEMSGAGHKSESGSKAVQRLDAAGNTTKALTKGFAIATAVVAAVALFHSYVEEAQLTLAGLPLELPVIFLGFLIGGAAPFLFAAFSINAVGRAAFELINEVRKQFRNDPGIMQGTSKPNYANCVAIVTKAAQTELLGPGVLAIALPMAVAFGFAMLPGGMSTINGVTYNLAGAQALGGFLAGSILSGQLLAVLLANSGGIWDNAKKVIEDGMHGGKGTEAHKAGVVCDTVGDPFKDTAGPALNPLIKVMNLVALLLAPTIIVPYGTGILATITLICIGALAFSIWWSKRSGMSSGLTQADPTPSVAAAAPKKTITVEDEE